VVCVYVWEENKSFTTIVNGMAPYGGVGGLIELLLWCVICDAISRPRGRVYVQRPLVQIRSSLKDDTLSDLPLIPLKMTREY